MTLTERPRGSGSDSPTGSGRARGSPHPPIGSDRDSGRDMPGHPISERYVDLHIENSFPK